MKCTTPGRNIRVFGRAIQCLSKIGEDIYFEGEASGLAVRTVNLSRSAYANLLFNTSFFSKFSLQSQNSGELRCKVSSKACAAIFKNLSSLEKTVEKFSLELKFQEGEFIVTIEHRSGMKKQHSLTFQDCEGLSAIFNKNTALIHIVSDNKFLSECTLHFPSSVNEINMSVKESCTILSNYVEEMDQQAKVLQTQMKLSSSEFPQYDVSVERDITFCLKEWRAILAFQDSVALPLHLYFDNPGRPIIMTIEGDSLYECNFVLATLTDQNTTQYSQTSTVSKVVNANPAPSNHAPPRKRSHETPPPQPPQQEEEEEEDNPFLGEPGKPVFSPELRCSPPSSPTGQLPTTEKTLISSPDLPVSPPQKRFKRLSSEDDMDSSAIQASNNVIYCGESD